MQQNSKCRDRDETINHIISDCSKLVQKEYKTRHDWVRKVIYWELCKKCKFDYTNKRYMHNPESVFEKEPQTSLGFGGTNRSPDQVIVNQKKKKKEYKRTSQIDEFTIPADHRIKLKERQKIDKYLDLARELKKQRNMKVTMIPIVSAALGTIPKGLVKELKGLEIRGQVETIHITVLSMSVEILRRVQET